MFQRGFHFLELWAENETRTRDPNLGKVVLYQLSYFRKYLLMERKTRLELATPTLARLCSTNWAISALSFELTSDISTELRVQRYSIFAYFQNFL